MKLPGISARQLVKVLEKEGFVKIRQEGSHIVLKKMSSAGQITVVVPNHKELTKGTLHSVLRKAEITRERLIELLSVLLTVFRL